jgi:hypothetical protein
VRSAIALALIAALAAAALQWVVSLGVQAAKLAPLRELTRTQNEDSIAIVYERSLFRSRQEFTAFGDPLRPAMRPLLADVLATDFQVDTTFEPPQTEAELKREVLNESMLALTTQLQRAREHVANTDYLTVSNFGFPFHSLQLSRQVLTRSQTPRPLAPTPPSTQQEWTSRLIVPLKVLWLPMAGNMASFALAALAARALFLATRRTLRRRRGLCPTCAYQTSLPTCPECGHREAKPHSSPPTTATATT